MKEEKERRFNEKVERLPTDPNQAKLLLKNRELTADFELAKEIIRRFKFDPYDFGSTFTSQIFMHLR